VRATTQIRKTPRRQFILPPSDLSSHPIYILCFSHPPRASVMSPTDRGVSICHRQAPKLPSPECCRQKLQEEQAENPGASRNGHTTSISPPLAAASPALARLLRDDIATTYGKDLPSAVARLDDDFEACIVPLRFPLGHRRVIRTTDEIDNLFFVGSLARSGAASSVRRRHGGKRAVGMRLCQRRQPPKAMAAGQRLQSRIPTATIGRGARGGCSVQGEAAGSRTTAPSGRN
jgi:hypothetical protein